VILIRFIVIFALSVLIGAFVSANAPDAYAQSAACDSDFEDVMEARARLEAMREVEIAQHLILKPDSVLEYSCFYDRLDELGVSANNMFSDNVNTVDLFQAVPTDTYSGTLVNGDSVFNPTGPYATSAPLPTINEVAVTAAGSATGTVVFGPNPPPFSPGALLSSGLENSLGMLVTSTLNSFLGVSFSHPYGGGSFTALPISSVCDPMNSVWAFSKCSNFDVILFKGFLAHSAIDYRVNPVGCSDSSRGALWGVEIAAAFPDPDTTGGIEVDFPFTDASGSYNVYERSLEAMDSNNCAAVEPVPTGVFVYSDSPPSITHEDHVCPAAGCFYNPSGGGSCEETP